MADANDDNKEPVDDSKQEQEQAVAFKVQRPIAFLESRENLRAESNAKRHSTAPKEPTRGERRRETLRRSKGLLQQPEISKLDYIRNLNADWFLSPTFIKLFQFLLISVYGVYGLMALMLMIFYILDVQSSVFEDNIIDNASSIMLIFLFFNMLLMLIGLYSSFIIGESEENMERLKKIYLGLNANQAECNELSHYLIEDGEHFLVQNDIFIEGQSEVKYELSKSLYRLHKLGMTLHEYSQKERNEEMNRLKHEIQMMYQDVYLHFLLLRCQHDRSKIIKLFYSKQLAKDKRSALNVDEFNQLKESLDADSTTDDPIHEMVMFDFPEFEHCDKDANGHVDIIEFEQQLNKVYKSVLEKITADYRKNRSPEDIAIAKEQRETEHTEQATLLDQFARGFGLRAKKKK